MSVITFIIVLGLLVATHELGHFLAAKFFGVKVEEFALGFPPKLWSKQVGETKYAINLIPFGGYVKVFGEEDDSHIAEENKNRALVNKPKWIQAVVLAAGVCGNVLLAWFFFSVAFVFGFPLSGEALNRYQNIDHRTIVTSVVSGSAAAETAVGVGDQLLEVKTKDGSSKPQSIAELRSLVAKSGGEPMTFELTKSGQNKEVTITPRADGADNYLLGLAISSVGVVKLPIYLSVWEGARVTVITIKDTFVGFGFLINEIIQGHSVKDAVAGPIGIANLVGEAETLGFVYLLTFIAFISVNLAVLNILPIPALDGGRLLFLVIEKVMGRPIKRQTAIKVNLISFLILISLMLVITGLDVWRLIK